MIKQRKLLNIVITVAFALAVVTIFMGFFHGMLVYIKDAGKIEPGVPTTLFDIMFTDKSYFFHRKGILIFAFACSILAILALGALGTFNWMKKTNKYLNMGLIIGAFAMLIISAIIMVCICPVLGLNKPDNHYIWKTGVGAINWGIISFVSAGCLVGAFLLNRKAFH